MNSITRDPIDIEALRKRAHHKKAGAMILFCGDVRNHSSGKEVVALDYDAHESMALKQINNIVVKATADYNLHFAEVIHRFGKIGVLECSIAIAISSSHRKEAYIASKFIIDSIKHAVPIWKKEYFSDGTEQWSKGCEACSVDEMKENNINHQKHEHKH